MRDIKSFLANLPSGPGVYQMLDDKGGVIYVGKAKHLKKRVSSYFSGQVKDLKTLSLIKHIKNITVTITQTETEAVLLECNLIKKYRPRYNVLLRDDKSYPYIIITNHPYPRIDIYRGQRKKNGLYFGPYPSSLAVREAINLLQKLFLLRTCEDSVYQGRSRPCLLHQIGRCAGPCVGLVSKEDYAQNVRLAILFLEGKSDDVITALQTKMEVAANELNYELASHYRDQIARLRQLQARQYVDVAKGQADVIGFAEYSNMVCLQLVFIRNGQVLGSRAHFPAVPLHSDKGEILSAFISQYYLERYTDSHRMPQQILLDTSLQDGDVLQKSLSEQAGRKVTLLHPKRGEKAKWLEMANVNARQSLAATLLCSANMQKRMHALQVALDVKPKIERIECFDISHSMGEATVASCVVFNQNGPLKQDYRRFNITDVTPGDDVAAIHQAILRRFKRLQSEHAALPDILFIDGGRTQLAAAERVLAELGISGIKLVGVSKGPGRKAGFESLHETGRPARHLPADSLALHLIQQIRDEAHRFAITGHRQRRDKTRRQSMLESIPGIGAKRRRDLLRYFGGIQGVAHASLDELRKVPGISDSLAEKIFAALHDNTI